MKLKEAIAHHGLIHRFRAVYHPNALPEAVKAWLRKQPELEGIFIPNCLRAVRNFFECPGQKGGKRKAKSGPSIVRVHRGRNQYSVS